MRKLLLITILFASLFSCSTPDIEPDPVVVTPPVTETPPTVTTPPVTTPPVIAVLKPAIVNVTGYSRRLTSKTTEIDSTKQRLIYTIRKDNKLDSTFYKYDTKGRLVKVTNEYKGVLRTFGYDDNDKMIKYTDPGHYLSYCSFDDIGRVIGSHRNANDTIDNETKIIYESGRIKTISHTNGQRQEYEYDTVYDKFFIVHYYLNDREYLTQKNWYDDHKPGTYSLEKNNLYDPAKYMYVEFYQKGDGVILSTERKYDKFGYLTQGYDEESNNVLIYVYEFY